MNKRTDTIRRTRDGKGAADEGAPSTMIYGIHAFEELLKSRPEEIDRIYFSQESKSSSALFECIRQCRRQRRSYHLVPRRKLDDIAGNVDHQGVVALCAARAFTPIETILEALASAGHAPVVLIPASVEDPRNLGAIFRSCAAFGVDAVLLEKRHTAPLGSVALKASAGMMEHVPVARPRDLESLVKKFRDGGYAVIGAEPGAGRSLYETDLRVPAVFVIGGEHRGIPPYLLRQCTTLVKIPMDPRAQSLNVSVAAGIMLYECRRQREKNGIME